jgi:hypothetical protein
MPRCQPDFKRPYRSPYHNISDVIVCLNEVIENVNYTNKLIK